MFKLRYLKKGIATILVIGLVMMTRDFALKNHHLEKVSYSLDKNYPESDLEAHNASRFKSSVLKNELSNVKTVLITPKKIHTVSNCGYDVC